MAADLVLFRNAVRAGLSDVRRVPGANSKQKTGRCLLECLKNGKRAASAASGGLLLAPGWPPAGRNAN